MHNKEVQITFWGTRGSLAKPGFGTVRYGGNTSCVELRSPAGTLIVIDCGTGAHGLGQALVKTGQDHLHGHLLISHTHWDHIQGIPFFTPFFIPQSQWHIYGPRGLGASIQDMLAGQMQYAYFPIALDQLNASLHYHDLVEGTFAIENVQVTARYLNHTMLTCGYRFEVDGVVVVYACDHEPYSQILAVGEGEISGPDREYAEFLRNADLVIHDAQYTAAEYPSKVGWGHSTIEYVLKLCRYAGVKRVALTHHDPLRDDEAIDHLLQKIDDSQSQAESSLEVFAAAEGQILHLPVTRMKAVKNVAPSAKLTVSPALVESSIVSYIVNKDANKALQEITHSDKIPLTPVTEPEALQKHVTQQSPSLIVMEHQQPQLNALELSRRIQQTQEKHQHNHPSTIALLTQKEEDSAEMAAAGVTDWLVLPCSKQYLRSKIHAWLLRRVCRWQRAPIPADEEERLAALQALKILDTGSEERFDRVTRLAARLFNVPVVFVSLVDRDRQWIKACVGASHSEDPREVSFCAHAVYHRDVLIVPDTLQDDRFADNPLVVNQPFIRFYAGCPLILKNKACVGTLCLIDMFPRFFQEKEVKLLEDLRDLVVAELESTT